MVRSKLELPGAIFHPVALVWSALRSGAPKTPDSSALGPMTFLRRQLRLHEPPSEFAGQGFVLTWALSVALSSERSGKLSG
eukprot:scaffold28117_cov64-Phaeocystis_antarctica.AAC.3